MLAKHIFLHQNRAWLWIAIIAANVAAAKAAEPDRFVSLSRFCDGNPATDDRARAKTNINAVSFKTHSLTTTLTATVFGLAG